jgi:hypothetical protein
LREHLQPEQIAVIAEISTAYVAWRYGEQEANVAYLGLAEKS